MEDTLITTIVGGFVLAFIFGLIAQRFSLQPLVGYLLAGVVCGPYTPGFTADGALAHQMADIGIILLMFGVGLHFSFHELMEVRRLVVPGALLEMALVSLLGYGVGRLCGFPSGESMLFGFSLSIASTVVLLKGLEERGTAETTKGRLSIGWLIVEDISTVLALVLLPAIFGAENTDGGGAMAWAIGLTIGKIALFVVLMLVVGIRVLPWLLVGIAKQKSRELFTLGVLAVALGIAYAAARWFGASFALGAFLAGLVLNETEISHKAAEKSLPLRDAFAVLFFVSVGMLFDPLILIHEPLQVLGVLLAIMLGKSLLAALVILALRYPLEIAFPIAAALAQIGEFSFILAGLGRHYHVLSDNAYALILAGALLSISLNPFYFRFVQKLGVKLRASPRINAALTQWERPLAASNGT